MNPHRSEVSCARAMNLHVASLLLSSGNTARSRSAQSWYLYTMPALFRNMSFLLHGGKWFTSAAYARASKEWDNRVMERQLKGRVCMVTGANQGLGLQVSEELARRGATVLMVCRNAERGQAAVEQVRSKTGNQDIHLKVCDVSSMASIRALISELEASEQQVHVLINNAGCMVHERMPTPDGLDVNWATNTLGPWLLTRLLTARLQQSAPAKVIFVSSGGMYTQPLNLNVLRAGGPGESKKYDGTVVYAQDKRRQVALCERFAEMLTETGVYCYSMHPGWATTEGVKKSIPGFYNFYKEKFRDVQQGADTIVYLTLQDDSKLEPGAFYLDRKAQPKHLSMAGTKYSREEVDMLWRRLEDIAASPSPSPKRGNSASGK